MTFRWQKILDVLWPWGVHRHQKRTPRRVRTSSSSFPRPTADARSTSVLRHQKQAPRPPADAESTKTIREAEYALSSDGAQPDVQSSATPGTSASANSDKAQDSPQTGDDVPVAGSTTPSDPEPELHAQQRVPRPAVALNPDDYNHDVRPEAPHRARKPEYTGHSKGHVVRYRYNSGVAPPSNEWRVNIASDSPREVSTSPPMARGREGLC